MNKNGSVTITRDYYPYGKPLPGRFFSSSYEDRRYQFTGHEYDEENNHDYHGARYYNRDIGRYLSVDPLSSVAPGWTPYRYAYNNPLRYIDPTGMLEGDYYDKEGNWLGNDGIDDDKVYVVKGEDKFNIKDFEEGGKYHNNQSAYNENNGDGFSVNYVGDVTGVSMTFTGSANSGNSKQADGQLNVIHSVSNGKDYTRASFSAVGGPWGNGSPENGDYLVNTLLDRGPNGWYNKGMTKDGVGFSLNLNPQFKTGRTDLRIHPDGGDWFGTQGCIGLTCGKGGLIEFRGLMQSILSNQSNILLNINILNNPNNNGYNKKVKSNGE